MKNEVKSILIISTIMAFVMYTSLHAVLAWVTSGNNFDYAMTALTPCKKIIPLSSDKKAIIRLDDVQAMAYTQVTEKLIKDTAKYNMLMVLGVIPKGLEYDKEMTKLLRTQHCNFEIALHGWDHQQRYAESNTFEFEDLSSVEALRRINLGIKSLKKYTNYKVVTFIPPGSKISDGTLEAIKSTDLKIISTEGNDIYDFTTATFDYVNNQMIPNDTIMKNCEEKFNIKKPCIIVIHPQDYLTDGKFDDNKYNTYIDLLNRLKDSKVSTTTFNSYLK